MNILNDLLKTRTRNRLQHIAVLVIFLLFLFMLDLLTVFLGWLLMTAYLILVVFVAYTLVVSSGMHGTHKQ